MYMYMRVLHLTNTIVPYVMLRKEDEVNRGTSFLEY